MLEEQCQLIRSILESKENPTKKESPFWKRIRRKKKRLRKRMAKEAAREKIKKHGPSKYSNPRWIKLKGLVYEIYEKKCMRCFCTDKKMNVDHVLPWTLYEQYAFNILNMQILCCDCNKNKYIDNVTDYRTDDDIRSMMDFVRVNHERLKKSRISFDVVDPSSIKKEQDETDRQFKRRKKLIQKAHHATKKETQKRYVIRRSRDGGIISKTETQNTYTPAIIVKRNPI